jgi:outer membrane protein assembly factor BamA
MFSDMLGEHLLGVSFGVNGGVSDISTSVSYINRRSRWNWGVFAERVPLLSGTVRSGFTNTGLFVEEAIILRQTYTQVGGVIAYPLSRVTRVEFGASAQRINYDNEVRTRVFDPGTGELLADDKSDLPSSEDLNFFAGSTALVRDTAVFGATSPIKGERLRLEFSPMFGDLRLNDVTLDYRHYVMPVRPITFAGRFIHDGRYGRSAEDERLSPLFLGYPSLVRGYDVNTFDSSDCTFTPTGGCPEYDRLLGTRIMVMNAEVRAPIAGLFNRSLDYGPIPVEVFGFFDTGVAWTRNITPDFAGGTRPFVSSAGFGARVNLFGFAIGEFNMARPLDRHGRGWMFVFNLRPGF